MSGGATNLAGVTDMSPLMRLVNAATDTYTVRGILGAGISNVVVGVDTGNAADGAIVHALATTVAGKANSTAAADPNNPETINGNWLFAYQPTIPGFYTAMQVDAIINDVATAAVNAATVGAPIVWFTSGGVYPPRLATGRPLFFRDPTVQPTNDGSIDGGGGMVPGLDIWFGS
jgi:hypothetical protein